jgi:hypothetical protein
MAALDELAPYLKAGRKIPAQDYKRVVLGKKALEKEWLTLVCDIR